MVSMIRHEKESIIEDRNTVLELRKSAKILKKEFAKRKDLQQETTQTVHELIQTKEGVRRLRRDHQQRLAAFSSRETVIPLFDSTQQSYRI